MKIDFPQELKWHYSKLMVIGVIDICFSTSKGDTFKSHKKAKLYGSLYIPILYLGGIRQS